MIVESGSGRMEGGDVEVGDEGEQGMEDGEKKEQEVDKDSLLAETV